MVRKYKRMLSREAEGGAPPALRTQLWGTLRY